MHAYDFHSRKICMHICFTLLICKGCAFNTYGPALTSLQNKYETDDATISRVFTILTGCYMVGALCGKFINYSYFSLIINISKLTKENL